MAALCEFDAECCGDLSSISSSETGTEATEHESTSSCVSLLDRLRSPKPQEKGERRSHGRATIGPKSVTPSQRVSEHPGECLTVSNKQLVCRACREELSLIGSVVHNHVKSAKHQARKKRLSTKEKCEQDIAKALKVLKASDEVTHPVGETLPQDQRIYRVKVVTAFL